MVQTMSMVFDVVLDHNLLCRIQVTHIKAPKTAEDEFIEIQTATGTPVQRWAVRSLTLCKLVSAKSRAVWSGSRSDVKPDISVCSCVGAEEHGVSSVCRAEVCHSLHGHHLVLHGL